MTRSPTPPEPPRPAAFRRRAAAPSLSPGAVAYTARVLPAAPARPARPGHRTARPSQEDR
ncbi:hypothetical protein [Streptomyces sp. NPDC093589]|uniref:hypothetical protein n=1 Tax=Streptomyces sp. NPDC093589 TaxID=3366043 RepID=UPI00380A7539